MKKILWSIFAIAFSPLVIYQFYYIYKILYITNEINMQELAILILVFELLLASITAVYEKGHFPLRYLLIFVISALIFYLAINKSTLTGTMILTYSVSISILALIYVLVKFLNKKYSLFD